LTKFPVTLYFFIKDFIALVIVADIATLIAFIAIVNVTVIIAIILSVIIS